MKEMSAPPLKHFLIVFDRSTGRQLALEEFSSSERALAAYEAAESNKGDDKMIDVVLVGSDSLETVKVTHASYFREGLTAENLEDYLNEFSRKNGLPAFAG